MSKSIVVAAALAVLALTAPASAFADWFVAEEELSGTAALATTAKVDKENVFKGGGVTVSCSGNALNSAAPVISAPNEMTASGIAFTGCKASTPCSLAKSEIKTESVVAELTSEGVVAASATFKPKTGSLFTKLKFEGSECAFEGEQSLSGRATALLPTGEEEEASQALSWDTVESAKELKIGSSSASLEGSSLLRLASGKQWVSVPRAFRALNPSNNSGIELKAKQEGGKIIEFKLAGTLDRIECISGVTFASQTINLARWDLDLKPTYPANCTTGIAGETTTATTIRGCGTFELSSAGAFGLGAECEFAARLANFPNCVVKIPAVPNRTGITYVSAGSTKTIAATIRATPVAYSATNCSVGGGNGEVNANLVIEGFKPANTAVSIEVG